MAKLYPHKQTIVIAIICVLAVGTTAEYVYVKPSPVLPNNIAVNQVKTNNSIIDTGTDWKKQFFDIASNTKAISGTNTINETASDTPLTLTDKVGRDFFARYIELKQNGLDTNQQLVQGVIDQTISNAQLNTNTAKVYSYSDLTISNDISSSSIHQYGNQVGTIFLVNSPKNTAPEIAYTAFEKNDLSTLSQIELIVNAFKKMSELLLKVPVPSSIAQNHLDIINEINSMAQISNDLRNMEGDPMQSMVSLSKYGQMQTNLYNSLLKIQSYLISQNINYLNNESGIFFYSLKPQQ